MRSLTKREQEIYDLLTKEFLTKKQIGSRLGICRQAIERHIRNLRQKGYIHFGVAKNNFIQSTMLHTPISCGNHKIRLHGQEFNIRILLKTKEYEQARQRSNTILIDTNTIRLYENSIEIYSGKSFIGNTPQEVEGLSMKYWAGFIIRMENELGVSLIKPRHQNIKLVNQHFAETNNELAKESEVKGDKIKVFTTDDGKLWFKIDNSFQLHEAEFLHPETSKQDAEEVATKFFNDIRDNKPPTMSEIMKTMSLLVKTLGVSNKINQETASGLNAVTKYLKSQLPTEEPKEEKAKKDVPSYVG